MVSRLRSFGENNGFVKYTIRSTNIGMPPTLGNGIKFSDVSAPKVRYIVSVALY